MNIGFDELISALEHRISAYDVGSRIYFYNELLKSVRGFRNNNEIFTACFSKKADNLPMWREYGDNGAGISISFRPRAITDMLGRLQEVEYIDTGGVSDAEAILNAVTEVYEDDHDNPFEIKVIETISFMMAKITGAKHETWSYENEVRLGFSQPLKNHFNDDNQFSTVTLTSDGEDIKWMQPSERDRGGENIRYLSLPFGIWNDGKNNFKKSIACVTLGPNCPIEPNQIHNDLGVYGFDAFEINLSECAIR